jgi:hypothetical protein
VVGARLDRRVDGEEATALQALAVHGRLDDLTLRLLAGSLAQHLVAEHAGVKGRLGLVQAGHAPVALSLNGQVVRVHLCERVNVCVRERERELIHVRGIKKYNK